MKKVLSLVLAAALSLALLAGCGQPQAAPGQSGAPAPSSAPPDSGPNRLKVVLVVADTIDSIWNRAMTLSLQRLKDAGEPFEFTYIENTTTDSAESVLRTCADSGYDIIIAHAGVCRDAVPKIKDEYPNIIFLGGGNGWETPEPNIGAYDQALHEGCYVQGVIAGLITKTNVVGFVGGMPTSNVTSELNAFQRGVESVNPDCKVVVSYIESWYDPVKAKECTNSQISMGADVVFGERDGVIQACQEAGIYAMAEKLDQSEIAPDTVIAQSIIRWDNTMKEVFNLVSQGKFECRYYTSYEGSLASGTCEVMINEDVVPADIVAKAREVEGQIISGAISVPFEP
ncbi:BMP family protein [Pseudoflavonifractor sp. 524-17]|uniref:BMP family protein n=1 Tax=Pseudoflavonifractor sp. 524-17 TaxID=2304577 RepID=UPI00137962B7|nr:BMP family protein [Pseudoflavonifractor sp. 524-17]